MRGTPAHAAQDREPSQVCRLGGRQSLQELKTSQRAPASANFASSAPNSSLYYHHSAARIAEIGFETTTSGRNLPKEWQGPEPKNPDEPQTSNDGRLAFLTRRKTDLPQSPRPSQ